MPEFDWRISCRQNVSWLTSCVAKCEICSLFFFLFYKFLNIDLNYKMTGLHRFHTGKQKDKQEDLFLVSCFKAQMQDFSLSTGKTNASVDSCASPGNDMQSEKATVTILGFFEGHGIGFFLC